LSERSTQFEEPYGVRRRHDPGRVLDANVVVSGVLSENGVSGRILKAWKAERFHLVR